MAAEGKRLAVGNARLMTAVGAQPIECSEAGTLVHVAMDGKYQGHILISDQLKPTAGEAIETLRRRGVDRTVMLTGDSSKVGQKVALDLGIDQVKCELLPEDKVNEVEKLLTEELAVEGEIVTCYLTGLNYLQKGEPKKALPLFDRLLKISSLTDDQKAEYTYMRGVANLSAENYKAAKADFDAAIALGLDSTEIHYNAAVAALALEDYEAAKKELEIAAGRKDNAELAKSAKEMLEAIKAAQ